MRYHVSKKGNDYNVGTEEKPFLTISQAAKIAKENDSIIVHEGTYRECVNPIHMGTDNYHRITYSAADGEKVIIKGSEIIENWSQVEGGIWKTEIDNLFFGDYNPYKEIINGDWLVRPVGPFLHTGSVYIDGVVLKEQFNLSDVKQEVMTWCCEVDNDKTTIYANFEKEKVSDHTIEINVRKSCFYPERTGVNYITVSDFEFAHAACTWAPPTADQIGMLSVHWSKGWIIENNIFHDARCCAISIGKEISTGQNECTTFYRKPGCQTQLETVFNALQIGWSTETIGSHIIRNNVIFDCGQAGIVGNLGGILCEIYDNEIYNIGIKKEFEGWEIAGIKIHAAIDTYIHNNYIHECIRGTWLDWQAQGVRLSSNLYRNNPGEDLFVEVSHGPYVIDNNIFASNCSLINAAQGGAYIHNLFCGKIEAHDVLTRGTPYHFAHSTTVKGTAPVYGFDDRIYQNIFMGCNTEEKEKSGTVRYNDCPASLEEYVSVVVDNNAEGGNSFDIDNYYDVKQPAYINNNSYCNNAGHFFKEEEYSLIENANVNFLEDDEYVYLEMNIPTCKLIQNTKLIGTDNLARPRIVNEVYENADGTPLLIDRDYFGSLRAVKPVVGPFESIGDKMVVWSRKNRV